MPASRRRFLRGAGGTLCAAALPAGVVRLAFADNTREISFACISDAHIQQIRGGQFVRNWDDQLRLAVAEINRLRPAPDFVLFGGDLAQLGKRAELDHGADILSGLHAPCRMVVGEHDYYLNMGEHWRELFGPSHYSFALKGVHFIVLNNILTSDNWSAQWPSAQRRMAEMACLENPNCDAFRLGNAQLDWLARELAPLANDTPLVLFTHAPLQQLYRPWNFWTEEAPVVHALLARFRQVEVFHGHVHQQGQQQLGNIRFTALPASAWAWPYAAPSVPTSTRGASHIPLMTLGADDPARAATGWELVNLHSGRAERQIVFPGTGPASVAG
ncbi:serine/threonine protein phosphatase [Mangrovimicrobium sediminis]|uniref:Serine/threonine protein phosphatase n=1 Tax=Mangrovimicrobium sediminis TaxID=2562682 RepID=A0A4Z0M8N7_9GAMM|nr:metallophosphoesterase [Haliea sp. SAOS-164]TGD75844.1 serine/threonine protein phosphatase [Haliea sp. SAOS-164]